jgi:cob(I)alamin adenosyltransferase
MGFRRSNASKRVALGIAAILRVLRATDMLPGEGLGEARLSFSPRRMRTYVGFRFCAGLAWRSPVTREERSLAMTTDFYKERPVKRGLLMINTGEGKGKTTAALGLIYRALGHDFRVCLLQFIKGSRISGELVSSDRFKDLLDVFVLGEGFTWNSKGIQRHIKAAVKAWSFAKRLILSSKYRLIVLDEFTYLVKHNVLNECEVQDVLVNRPEGTHVLITGRNAPDCLLQIADMVTDMKAVRHHFNDGVTSQPGIEF